MNYLSTINVFDGRFTEEKVDVILVFSRSNKVRRYEKKEGLFKN